MKLSTKGRYGVKAMIDLAVHAQEGRVVLKEIAQRQNISEHYLEQIMSLLRKAGLVKSIRGAYGGYILANEPKNITVGKILRALEGSLAPVDCVTGDEAFECDEEMKCVAKGIWLQIWDSVNQVVDSITLEQLVEQYKDINEENINMYYI